MDIISPAIKIEKIMELVMELNDDIASRNVYINNLEEKYNVLNTFKEVNCYIGNSIKINDVIQRIIDVVVGVLGVTVCSICLKKEDWEITEQSIFGDSTKIISLDIVEEVNKTIKENEQELIINDLSLVPMMCLNEGTLISIRISRSEKDFGLIVIYYSHANAISEIKLEFFRLIATQLGLHLENAFLFERVVRISEIDGLTNLYNRKYLNEMIYNESSLNIKEFGVIMIDIDNFKKVNDTYGHVFGDVVIKYIAETVNNISSLYKDALAFRYGGEELLILFQGTSVEDIYEAGEKIRTDVNSKIFEIEGKSLVFSVSIGISKNGFSAKLSDIKVFSLINLANEALYVAKDSGKNRCIISTGKLQLYIKSREIINKQISKFARFNKSFTILKIDVDIGEFYITDTYNKLIESIRKKFREYDYVFSNFKGEILIIIENEICDDMINKKLENIIGTNFSFNKLIWDNGNGNGNDIKNFLGM